MDFTMKWTFYKILWMNIFKEQWGPRSLANNEAGNPKDHMSVRHLF